VVRAHPSREIDPLAAGPGLVQVYFIAVYLGIHQGTPTIASQEVSMKKNPLKKNLKLQLHRETLHTLEQPARVELVEVVGGDASQSSCGVRCFTTCTQHC
jgi:hypothetical protein